MRALPQFTLADQPGTFHIDAWYTDAPRHHQILLVVHGPTHRPNEALVSVLARIDERTRTILNTITWSSAYNAYVVRDYYNPDPHFGDTPSYAGYRLEMAFGLHTPVAMCIYHPNGTVAASTAYGANFTVPWQDVKDVYPGLP